ncbi:hypothetical protein ACSAGD_09015 [Paramicrobacterium sp. CJ85]
MSDEKDASGGDPVCWLDRVCDECGAFIEDGSDTCWRCGAVKSVDG